MNIRQAVSAAHALGQTGLFRPVRPLEYLRMAQLTLRWGPSLAAASAIAVLRAPHRMAVADDIGLSVLAGASIVLPMRSLHALARLGVGPETTVGLMCRNSRYFVEATLAVSKLGANLVLLNTDFGPHQLGEVLKREGVGAAVFDDEFAPTFRMAEFEGVFGRRRRRSEKLRSPGTGASPRAAKAARAYRDHDLRNDRVAERCAARHAHASCRHGRERLLPAALAGEGAGGRRAAPLPLAGVRLHGIRLGPPGHPRRTEQVRPRGPCWPPLPITGQRRSSPCRSCSDASSDCPSGLAADTTRPRFA